MKRFIDVFGMLLIAATAFIASAGALNYGFASHEHIYTVFGIINIIGWAYAGYKWAKTRGIL